MFQKKKNKPCCCLKIVVWGEGLKYIYPNRKEQNRTIMNSDLRGFLGNTSEADSYSMSCSFIIF